MTTKPLTEGYVRKGGRNTVDDDFVRPAPPQSRKPDYDHEPIGKRAPPPPRPQPQDFNMAGVRHTSRYRLRVTWFGFVRLEELYEYSDGRRQWKRPRFSPVYIKGTWQDDY
jgi:hypothetical protein